MSLGVVGVSSPAYLFLDGLQEKEQLVLPIKERGNFNFKDGRYRAAIGDYTRAIRISLVSMETSILYYSLPLHSLLLLLFRSCPFRSCPFPPSHSLTLSPVHSVQSSTATDLFVTSKMETHGEQL